MGRKATPVEDRFWAKVRRSDGCWEWTGSCDRDGYGHLGAGDGTKRLLIAHRFSWELHNAPVPAGVQVLHTCDRPCCVNPAHLFLGSPATNAADKVAKGRQYRPIGQRPNARLTEADVVEIRRRLARGETQSAVGAGFGVSQATISLIATQKTWATTNATGS